MSAFSPFNDAILQSVCDILGATDSGLTGSEIGRHLSECNIPDPLPQMTKRHRLFAALQAKQNGDRCANNVIGFIMHVMSPVRHIGNREYFERERSKLNSVLAFNGLVLGEDGKIGVREAAQTLSQAEAIAGILRKALVERRVHADVTQFCTAELLVDNYFHAVFEATKSIAEKLRKKTGLTSDGAELVRDALGIGKAGYPRLAFNSLTTDSERSEQSGLMNLIIGLFGAFRNTTAHIPKIHWNVTEQDALDILTTISLVHRRLDEAIRTHVA